MLRPTKTLEKIPIPSTYINVKLEKYGVSSKYIQVNPMPKFAISNVEYKQTCPHFKVDQMEIDF